MSIDFITGVLCGVALTFTGMAWYFAQDAKRTYRRTVAGRSRT